MFAILIGVIFSNLLISSYQEEMVMKSEGNIYLLQYGVYTTKEVLSENIKNLRDYIVYEENNKYYVYLGIFVNYENAYKVSEILKNNDIYTYIKSDYLNDTDIVKKINILGEKMISLNKESEIKSLNREMLDLYQNYLD